MIQHACVLARGEVIETGDLPALREPAAPTVAAGSSQTLADQERHMILSTIREVGGNKTAAALRLGVTVRTLAKQTQVVSTAARQ